ncbi:MAG TPA: GNAT family N-acetyltransferase [Bryobacteraceae bacterium]|nr:GNAT family N-acetyltransferase [Bryobacteraceae bacterium]
MPISFRYASYDEYPAIARFLDEFWAKDHIYVRSKALFDWTFNRRGEWEDEGYSFALAEDNGDLVGILGGIPFTLNVLGRKSKAVWIVNYVIRPDHRKGSAALQLLSTFRRPPFQACIAFGINPATSAIYKVLRGQVINEIPRHFVVLPGASERMENILRIAYPDWDAGKIRKIASAYATPEIPGSPAANWDTVPSDWDQSQWPEFARAMVGADRSAEYLRWRYINHPCFGHRVIACEDGSRTGLAVWRVETIRRQIPEGRQDVDRIGRLLEFLPASPKNACDLTARLFQDLRKEDCLGADYYGYHGLTRAWLADAGFPQVHSGADDAAIPSRFQPLDAKGGGIMSATFLQEGIPHCSTDLNCSWYWTKSDSDQDRPN